MPLQYGILVTLVIQTNLCVCHVSRLIRNYKCWIDFGLALARSYSTIQPRETTRVCCNRSYVQLLVKRFGHNQQWQKGKYSFALMYQNTVASFVKPVCIAAEFITLLDQCCINCIKVVRSKPDQPNQWLRACIHSRIFKSNTKPKWLNSTTLKLIKRKYKAWNMYKATCCHSDFISQKCRHCFHKNSQIII